MGLRGHKGEVVQPDLADRVPPHWFVAVQDGGDERRIPRARGRNGDVLLPAVDEDGLPRPHEKTAASDAEEARGGKDQVELPVVVGVDALPFKRRPGGRRLRLRVRVEARKEKAPRRRGGAKRGEGFIKCAWFHVFHYGIFDKK